MFIRRAHQKNRLHLLYLLLCLSLWPGLPGAEAPSPTNTNPAGPGVEQQVDPADDLQPPAETGVTRGEVLAPAPFSVQLTIQVVHQNTEAAPVGNADVRIVYSSNEEYADNTDASGMVVFRRMPAGTPNLRVTAPALKTKRLKLNLENAEEQLVVELSPRLVEPVTDQPAPSDD